MKTKIPVTTDTIMVSRNVHMEQISALCGIDVEAIRALNPQYRTGVIPGQTEPCAIRLPQEKILAFIDQKDSIYNYRADELLTRRAVVAVSEPKAEPTRSTASLRQWQKRFCDRNGPRRQTAIARPPLSNCEKNTPASRSIRPPLLMVCVDASEGRCMSIFISL